MRGVYLYMLTVLTLLKRKCRQQAVDIYFFILLQIYAWVGCVEYIINGITLLYSFLIGVVLFLYFNMYVKS